MSDLTTHVFGAQHAEIAELLTDDSETGPTYGTPFDVPGLKSISVSPSSNSVELRGDNQLLVKETVLQTVEITLEFAKWDARIYALLTGSDLIEDALTGAYTVAYNTSSKPALFSLGAISAGATGGAQVAIFFPKLQITNLPDMIGLNEEDFKTVTVTCEAIPTAGGDWMSFSYSPAGLES
jgi:phi13 family phage major tail protein